MRGMRLKKIKIYNYRSFGEEKIIEFINKKFCYGDNLSIIQEIDSSKLLPSKSLQENIDKLLKGNKEFKLIDNQMIIYDGILSAIKSLI